MEAAKVTFRCLPEKRIENFDYDRICISDDLLFIVKRGKGEANLLSFPAAADSE